MTIATISWAFEQVVGDPIAKLLLIALADIADEDNLAPLSSERLARTCEMRSGQLALALRELQSAGFLVVHGRNAKLNAPTQPPSVDPARAKIFERDGWRCVYCGSADDLTIDHIIPRSRGGNGKPANLTTACLSCNISKGARTPDEWRAV